MIKRTRWNKKADLFQLIVLLILLFVVAVVGFLFATIDLKILNAWEDSGLLNQTAIGQEAVDKLQESAPRVSDYAVFFLFLGGFIGLCITAVRTQFSPIVLILFFGLMLLTIFIAAGFVNIYSGFEQAVPETANLLTLTGFIFSKYTPLLMGVVATILMLIMWGRSGGDITP